LCATNGRNHQRESADAGEAKKLTKIAIAGFIRYLVAREPVCQHLGHLTA